VSVAQLNCCKSRHALENVLSMGYDVVMLQEPPKTYSNSNGYNAVISGRAAIFIKGSVMGVNVVCKYEDFVCVNVGGTKFASLYMDCTVSPNIAFDIVEASGSQPNVLAIDSNAHHSLWGPDHIASNGRGNKTAEFIISNQFEIANDVEQGPTWMRRVRGKTQSSFIDITLYRHIEISHWKLSAKDSLSDHSIIEFSVNTKKTCRSKYILAWGSANWKALRRDVGRISLKAVSDCDSLDFFIRDFYKALESCINKHVPRVKENGPRYTAELRRMKKDVDELRVRACDRDHNGEWGVYRQARWKYREALRKHQDEWYSNFLRSKDIFCIMKKLFASKRAIRELDVNSIFAKFFPADDTCSDSVEFARVRYLVEDYLSKLKRCEVAIPNISLQQLNHIVERMDLSKAAGPDCVTGALLKGCWSQIAPNILKIVNGCLSHGYFPSQLKIARLVLIPKASGGERPLSITSYIGRIVENVFKERVLRLHNMPCQYAYQEGRSCINALHDIVSEVESQLASKGVSILVSLDIKGAFDRAKHAAVLFQLIDNGYHSSVVKFIASYLSERNIVFEDLLYTLSASTPQGGILSPFLFCIYINGLIEAVSGMMGVRVVCYADDIMIVANGCDIATAHSRSQAAVKAIEAYNSKFLGAVFAAEKCWSMLFTRRRAGVLPGVVVNNVVIPIVNEAKHLGVILDNRLSFLPHVKYVAARATALLQKARGALARKRALSNSTLSLLYICLIKPKLYYGIEIWGHRTSRVGIEAILNRVLRCTAIVQLGLFRTVRLETALALANIPPASIAAKELCSIAIARHESIRTFSARLLERAQWLRSLIDRNVALLGVLKYGCDVPKKRHRDVPISLRWRTTQGNSRKGVAVFTDGSYSSRGCGSGFSIFVDGQLIVLRTFAVPTETSVVFTELAGIWLAAQYCEAENLSSPSFFCDSQAALDMACSSRWKLTDLVFQLQECLIRLGASLFFIRGHSGLCGNVLADTMAVSQGFGARPVSLGLFIQHVECRAKRISHVEFSRYYGNADRNCVTHKFAPTLAAMQSLYAVIRSTPAVARLVSGHVFTADYARRFLGLVGTGTCGGCNNSLYTVAHLQFCTGCPWYVGDDIVALACRLASHDNQSLLPLTN
jgi:ribonuclease HI